jgi:signal transduction histidine kinase
LPRLAASGAPGAFTELVATAISNIEARSELAGSRARIVAAADQERRRVERDLHDGAQQRLVHTVITLKLARQALERGDDAALGHVTRRSTTLRRRPRSCASSPTASCLPP